MKSSVLMEVLRWGVDILATIEYNTMRYEIKQDGSTQTTINLTEPKFEYLMFFSNSK